MSSVGKEHEYQTRMRRIDPRLKIAGWSVKPFVPTAPVAAYTAAAVEEFETINGPADYALCDRGRVEAVAEQKEQMWAADMQDFLLDLHAAGQQWQLAGVGSVPTIERDEWMARFFEILAAGYAAQPPPLSREPGKRKGRHKQSKAKNLLDALLRRADQVLAFLDNLRIPFTNNQAERDIRMAKVQ